jgi:hypothetical protein
VHDFGGFLYELLAEARTGAVPGTNWTASLLEAFAADVSYSAKLLQGTVGEAAGAPWEHEAARQAQRWAERLEAIAADIEAFVALNDES